MKFSENDLEIVMFVYPPVPEAVASLSVFQCSFPIGCETNKLEIGQCGQDVIDEMNSYWVPRIGEENLRNYE